MFRNAAKALEVLLVKPGGPYWGGRDAGAWMIPKGAIEDGETSAQAAVREFEEETGMLVDATPFPLCSVRQAGGKIVEAFAVEGDLDPGALASNSFDMEWPPRSGLIQSFPEVAEARWFTISEACEMILPSQRPIVDALEERLTT